MPWYFIIISLSNFQALSFLMTRFGGFKETWLHTFSLNCVVCQLHQLHKGKRRIQRSQKVRHDLETEQLDYIQDDVALISYRTEFN